MEKTIKTLKNLMAMSNYFESNHVLQQNNYFRWGSAFSAHHRNISTAFMILFIVLSPIFSMANSSQVLGLSQDASGCYSCSVGRTCSKFCPPSANSCIYFPGERDSGYWQILSCRIAEASPK